MRLAFDYCRIYSVRILWFGCAVVTEKRGSRGLEQRGSGEVNKSAGRDGISPSGAEIVENVITYNSHVSDDIMVFRVLGTFCSMVRKPTPTTPYRLYIVTTSPTKDQSTQSPFVSSRATSNSLTTPPCSTYNPNWSFPANETSLEKFESVEGL